MGFYLLGEVHLLFSYLVLVDLSFIGSENHILYLFCECMYSVCACITDIQKLVIPNP